MKNNSNSLFSTRMRLKMTQKDIADKLGVARNYVYLMESGRKPVTDTIAQKLTELETAQVRETPEAKTETTIIPSVTNISAPTSTHGRYPQGCDLESELGEVKERLAAMEHQLGTVIRLLGASLHLSDTAADPGRPARKVG
jgi:transcriptional regulator with XRE-family HTH domain